MNLSRIGNHRETESEEVAVFRAIWNFPAPSKVSSLLWKLLHDRIPTKVNLYRRGVIHSEGYQSCAFCGNCAETAIHLLLYCDFATRVWRAVFDWLGMCLQFPHNFLSMFNSVACVPGRKQTRKALVMIWGAVIWALWQHRNQIVFENGTAEAAVVIETVKTSSWKWWIGISNGNPCLLYEWLSEPIVCMAT
ncbi:unnamed protein product [Trifolium pratense]|uniref:Uncharacterized protein n=1 Tax=Trifolium pratense TaxID=57577 RepID=A0ACB0LZH0_TRIPR|nr:unnamed protein product [Trifolium pratense]